MSDWQDNLDQRGAVRADDGTLLHFGTPPGENDGDLAAICDHLAVIRAGGEDARDFLQGQLSADLADITAGATRPAMHLNLKGRGVVSMRVLPAGDDFLLVLPRTAVDDCVRALGKFILRSRVSLEPDDSLVVLGLDGPLADGWLTQAGLPVPEPGQALRADDGIVLARHGQEPRYLVVTAREPALALWNALPTSARGGALHWRLSDIRAGEGQVLAGGEDRFMPQELNYDLLGGISFSKGCYVGQEVVARMHFRGRLKQRMRHLSWPADSAPPPGTTLRDDGGRGRGDLVDAVVADRRCHALVVLRHGHDGPLLWEQQPLDWRVESLPYEVPDDR